MGGSLERHPTLGHHTAGSRAHTVAAWRNHHLVPAQRLPGRLCGSAFDAVAAQDVLVDCCVGAFVGPLKRLIG